MSKQDRISQLERELESVREAYFKMINQSAQLSKVIREETFEKKARDYQKAGFDDFETMIKLSAMGIKPEYALRFSEVGFHGDYKAIETLFNELPVRRSVKANVTIEVAEEYANAGFSGRIDDIIELYRKEINPDFALMLAEHGLKGNKEEMISLKMNKVYFEEYAELIANQMGRQISWYDITYDPEQKKLYKNQRRKFANQINAKDIAILNKYTSELIDSREGKTEREMRKRFLYGPNFRSEKEKIDEFYSKLFELRAKRIFKAYEFIRDNGEEAFKDKYKIV